jgi:hypothetical protein
MSMHDDQVSLKDMLSHACEAVELIMALKKILQIA